MIGLYFIFMTTSYGFVQRFALPAAGVLWIACQVPKVNFIIGSKRRAKTFQSVG